jgi:alpha-1,6-mannosyltransferase
MPRTEYMTAATAEGRLRGEVGSLRRAGRHNDRIKGTLQIPQTTRSVSSHAYAQADGRPRAGNLSLSGTLPLRALGALGLLGIVTSAFLIAARAARSPSTYVRVRDAGWPGWISGPYQALGLGITKGSFETLILIMVGCYVLVLLGARTLPLAAVAGAIVAAHLLLLLGPPLLSQDVFGYISYARMGVLHGLDPYTHVPVEAPADPTFAYIGWPFQHSPYGPLFTLASYAIVPLGFAADLWAFKLLAVLCSLGAVALVAKAAAREGRSPQAAAAFLGLNPVLLVFAVGGAHNDMITGLLLAAALALTAGASPRLRAAAWPLAAAVGCKVSAGLLLPFLVLAPRTVAQRLKVLLNAAGGLLAIVVIGAIGFGLNLTGFILPIAEEQQQIAIHSIPAETARLLSLGGTPAWWRYIFLAGFICVVLICLWRTAKGFDWRVAAGWSTLALVISTAWLLPWYAVWALPLAAVSPDRKLRAAVLVFCAYAVAIRLPVAEPLLHSGV